MRGVFGVALAVDESFGQIVPDFGEALLDLTDLFGEIGVFLGLALEVGVVVEPIAGGRVESGKLVTSMATFPLGYGKGERALLKTVASMRGIGLVLKAHSK